jgi:hypothetical protein
MALIVPLEPEGVVPSGPAGDALAGDATGEATSGSHANWSSVPSNHRHPRRGAGNGTLFLGMLLVLFGGLALVDMFLPAWADGGRFLWPAFIVGVGALLVASAVRRQPTDS